MILDDWRNVCLFEYPQLILGIDNFSLENFIQRKNIIEMEELNVKLKKKIIKYRKQYGIYFSRQSKALIRKF